MHVKNDHSLSEQYGRQCCANGLILNQTIITSHSNLVHKVGLIPAITQLQAEHADIFLQPTDVRSNYRDFCQYDTLLELAEEGATIYTPKDFVYNNGVGATSRPVCRLVPSAIHARLSQEQAIGDSLILPQAVVREAAKAAGIQFHVSELSWVFKPGDNDSDLLGRLVDDYTNSAGGGINSSETLEAIVQHYGDVTNPQLVDLCQAYLDALDPTGEDLLSAATEDVSRAYRRVKVCPPYCLLQVLNLPHIDGFPPLYSIGMSGRFGYCGAGHTWAVAARALVWRFNQRCRDIGSPTYGQIYVDDLTFFPRRSQDQILIEYWTANCTSLCGKAARKASKAQCGPVSPSIGWVFSQPDERVFISEKGYLSLVACFFDLFPIGIRSNQAVAVTTLMRTAALTRRYVASMYTMGPFCSGFHRDLKGVTHYRGTRRISFRTVCDVWAWRAHLSICFRRLADLAIPIAWPPLRKLSATELIQRADSLVYVDAASTDRLIGVYVVNSLWSQFQFPSPRYYNRSRLEETTIAVMEMCGIVAGALLALQDPKQPPQPTPRHVHIVTDNTNAYYWSLSHKSSCPVLYFLLQTLALIAAQGSLMITHSWTSSTTNPVADAISRNFREPAMHVHLKLLRQTCHQTVVPPPFLHSTQTACEQSLATASATIRLALTPLVGTSS
jgi:hypothetical protein